MTSHFNTVYFHNSLPSIGAYYFAQPFLLHVYIVNEISWKPSQNPRVLYLIQQNNTTFLTVQMSICIPGMIDDIVVIVMMTSSCTLDIQCLAIPSALGSSLPESRSVFVPFISPTD